MRAASGALISLLNSNTEFLVADVMTLTPAGGSPIYLTSSDHDVTVNGHTFSSAGPTFNRGLVKLTVGLPTDTMAVTLLPKPGNLLTGLAWPAAATIGSLDGARVVLERAFMSSWTDTGAGTVQLFSGRVADVVVHRNTIDLTIANDLELLDIKMPRNLYQPGCVHTLFDAGCALVKATYTATGTVAAGSTASLINATVAGAGGLFDLGALTFTSGANLSVARAVKTFTAGGSFSLTAPFPVPPAIGDTFSVTQGCDKKQATCSGKFNNAARFRGYPFTPKNEAAR